VVWEVNRGLERGEREEGEGNVKRGRERGEGKRRKRIACWRIGRNGFWSETDRDIDVDTAAVMIQRLILPHGIID
jgi:hypothetical protein